MLPMAPRVACLALIALLLTGCNTVYKPSAVDGTGLYPTTVSVDPGGVIVGSEQVDLDAYGAVLLAVDSYTYPPRLEFVVRKALNEFGFRNVVNAAEFRRWAVDREFALKPGPLSDADLRRFSAEVEPVLVVTVRFAAAGGPRQYGWMRVSDARSGDALLTVDHAKTVWVNFDDEVLYPLLNELRRWKQHVGKRSV